MFVEPGVSGSKAFPKRPEGRNALEAVKRGDVLIALKLDRMFRDTTDALATVKPPG